MDVFTKRKRSQVMSSIRSRGNKDTELALLRIFREKSITGWRRHSSLVGKPDFVFARAKVAVFVDGCFWHGCLKHSRPPRSNQAYWRAKMVRNKVRDRSVTRALRRNGWCVLRIWEHDLAAVKRDQVCSRVRRALGAGMDTSPISRRKR